MAESHEFIETGEITIMEKLWIKIAWKLPKNLIMWAALRLMAHATQGQWGNDHPDDVSIMDALGRWDTA